MSPAFPAGRRADEFDRLLGGESREAAPSELARLARLASDLRQVADAARPSAAFSADLRDRLMSAATAELEPAARRAATTERLTVRGFSGGATARARRRLTAGIAALAIVAGTAGTALASQNALPGDALYPVKRALESLHTDVAVSQSSKGEVLLDDAGDRLTEVHELVRRQAGSADTARMTETLATFSQQAQQASAALVQAYQSSHDLRQLDHLKQFTSSSMTQLSQLAAVVPAPVQSALSAAAQTLLQIDQTVQQLCASCGPVLQLPQVLIEGLASTVKDLGDSIAPAKPSSSPTATAGQPTTKPLATRSSGAPATGGTTAKADTGQGRPSGLPTGGPGANGGPSPNGGNGGAKASGHKDPGAGVSSAASAIASDLGGVLTGVGTLVGGLLGGLLGGGSTPTP